MDIDSLQNDIKVELMLILLSFVNRLLSLTTKC